MNQKYAKIDILKQKLVSEKELIDVMRYFFDHIGEDAWFQQIEVRAQHDLLEAILPQTINAIPGLKTPLKVSTLILVTVPRTQFYHGMFLAGPVSGTIIYFADINAGMAAVTGSIFKGMTQFVRFSTLEKMGRPAPPSMN